jgi:hypothetical protein
MCGSMYILLYEIIKELENYPRWRGNYFLGSGTGVQQMAIQIALFRLHMDSLRCYS